MRGRAKFETEEEYVKQAEDPFRIGRKIIRMVAELHLRGYQRLRIIPHLSGLGTWRCGVTPASNIIPGQGIVPISWDPSVLPQYSSASGRDYFEWNDARRADPAKLAELFIARFPHVAEAGTGKDWKYAGWLCWLLHLTYPNALPIIAQDEPFPQNGWLTTIGGFVRDVHVPPPVNQE
jgi:hypothetical protein